MAFKRLLTCVFTFFCLAPTAFAQQADSLPPAPPDTPHIPAVVKRVQEASKEEARKSILKYQTNLLTKKQEELLEGLRLNSVAAGDYLKKGLDTTTISQELENIKNWYSIAADGVFNNKGTAQTYRNLTATYNILYELHKRALNRKQYIDNYEKDLRTFRFQIDSLSADSLMYNLPTDSAELIRFARRYIYIARDMSHTDSALDNAIVSAQQMQVQINQLVYQLNSSLEEINHYQQQLSLKTFNREFSNIWGEVGFRRPFTEILHYSVAKTRLNLGFYTADNLGRILLLLLLIACATFFMRSVKQKLQNENLLKDDFDGQLALRYPFLSAVVIVISLFQFIFPAPPFVFSTLLWVAAATCLTIIFRNFIVGYWMKFWLITLLLFIAACTINLVLQASRTERWGMLALALAGMGTGLYFLLKGHLKELREKLIIYFIALLVLLEAASAIANFYGRYNLSKTLLTAGFLNIITGILFLWVVRLINETLTLASDVYTTPEKKLFFINFNRVGNRAPALLYFLLVIGWLIVVGRNFYAFRLIAEPLKEFFITDRKIGSFSFTISNVLLFFLIISLSVITSKIVSFFASDSHVPAREAKERKAGVGSWLLLIRVTIITAGLLLALAATGFPMDRITIVIGALGVGIGLGLQTLVNNLVSGLIIAFEKPVNVGDIVEFGGQAGTMKSIGFRSSVVTTWEGADVVIPNGDILNAHLVNWTIAGNKRRLEIIVGVSYGTDLDKARHVLEQVLANDERILQYPAPTPLFQQFNNSSIDIRIVFWVRNIREGFPLKSDLIREIDKAFRRNGIVIPFPQQDLHIRTNSQFEIKPSDNSHEKQD
ncbi:mechanosensitive ion channel family protein [Foetidibacter luteolus]|uniref:mechanosensitive ion channel family protein n=1 Tax=Foetidibacter luteolus TaxID=2608880 RepID=UPI001A99274B|nr:mechanosensitive ion channel domain-containing protein [Foetidibacter luteolus]